MQQTDIRTGNHRAVRQLAAETFGDLARGQPLSARCSRERLPASWAPLGSLGPGATAGPAQPPLGLPALAQLACRLSRYDWAWLPGVAPRAKASMLPAPVL